MNNRTSGALGSGYFRTVFIPIVYACREANGSLKPVMSLGERRKKYCRHCTAPRCLFAPIDERSGEKNQAKVEAGRSKAAARRAKGLNSSGKPLTESCWNCVSVREVLDEGYVCRWESGAKPASRWTMEKSRRVEKTGCERFEMRLVMEIPFVDDALGGGG